MNEGNSTQSTADAQAIAEFCQYEHVTVTQIDSQRVQATFQDSFGEGSVTGTSVVSVLLAVARRQKVYEYLRGTRAMEQQLMDALHNLPVSLTITKIREQAYTWQVFTRTGTTYTLVDALARSLQAMTEQLRGKPDT